MKAGSISCVLPPHIFDQIAQNGSDSQKERYIQTAQVTAQFRSERLEATALAAAPRVTLNTNLQRRVYTTNHSTNLPGQLVRSEGDPDGADVTVNEAYNGAGATYNLYWNIYQRNSIDNAGMTIDSTVHYGQNYENAFWNGQQMVYGDGDEGLPPDQQLFNRFTIAIDVIGHELTHGVTQFEGGLIYSNQPGALNESFSDVFGSLVKQYSLGQALPRPIGLLAKAYLPPMCTVSASAR